MIRLKNKLKWENSTLKWLPFENRGNCFIFLRLIKIMEIFFPFHTLSRDFHKFLFFQISPLTIHAKVSAQMKKNDIT